MAPRGDRRRAGVASALAGAFLSAGEPSGDLHGAAVARALRARWPDVRLLGLGGPRMAAAGVELLAQARDFRLEFLSDLRAYTLLGSRLGLARARRFPPGRASDRRRGHRPSPCVIGRARACGLSRRALVCGAGLHLAVTARGERTCQMACLLLEATPAGLVDQRRDLAFVKERPQRGAGRVAGFVIEPLPTPRHVRPVARC